MEWAFNWDELCNVEVIPVTDDLTIRNIIKNQPGFHQRHKKLMAQMGMDNTGPCFVTARFTFKTNESKIKFIDILNSPDGLKITRNWPGSLSIDCYESTDNPLEFVIQQKWSKESDHSSYKAMRKKTQLFASVTDMLEAPLE